MTPASAAFQRFFFTSCPHLPNAVVCWEGGCITKRRRYVNTDRARARGIPCLRAILVTTMKHRRFRRGGRERGKLIERLHGFGHVHALLVFLRFIAAISSASGCCAA